MNRFSLSLFLFFAILSQSFSQKGNIQTQLKKNLSDPVLRTASIGVAVIDLPSGKPLFQMNSEKLFHPASTMKLFTTASALHFLGSKFEVRTEVFNDNNGNLFIKGYGDPLLRTDHYDSIAKRVSQSGVKKIKDIVVDVSYFDEKYWGKGWMWDDEPDASAMYITPLCANGNTVQVYVTPGKLNEKPFAEINPKSNYFLMENSAVTTKIFNAQSGKFEVTRKWMERDNTIMVKGGLPITAARDTFELNVWKPEVYAATLLKERLVVNGVAVDGNIRIGKIDGGKKLFSFSHSVDSIVYRANKESDNLCAENLLKVLAAEKYSVPGDGENGSQIEKSFLSETGIDTAAIVVADGSGVSDYNLVSATQTVQLLQRMFKDKRYFSLFQSSLPIAGVDGTLKNRMKGTIAEKKVFAKTGTKKGVSCLAGYVKLKNGNERAFAILINHFYGEAKILRAIIDKCVVAIAK